jgi:hypothetical protein
VHGSLYLEINNAHKYSNVIVLFLYTSGRLNNFDRCLRKILINVAKFIISAKVDVKNHTQALTPFTPVEYRGSNGFN